MYQNMTKVRQCKHEKGKLRIPESVSQPLRKSVSYQKKTRIFIVEMHLAT